jgi:hypothetical protein
MVAYTGSYFIAYAGSYFMHHCQTMMLPSSNLGRMGETILCFDVLLAPSTHLCLVPFDGEWIVLTSFHDGMDWCSTLEQRTVTSTATKCLDENFTRYLYKQGVYLLAYTRGVFDFHEELHLIKMSYPYGSRTSRMKIMRFLAAIDNMRPDTA